MFKLLIVLVASLNANLVNAIELKRPKKSQTLEALTYHISAMLIEKDRVIYLPYDEPELYVSPFKYSKKTGKLEFLNIIKSKRIKFDKKKVQHTEWAGIIHYGKDYLLVDGFDLKLSQMDEKFDFYRTNDIAWDLILPPKDRLGEAPKFEIKKMRKIFDLEMRTAPDKRIRGVALKGEQGSNVEFFVGTALKSFPLIIMSCSKEDISRCKFARNCRVPAFQAINPIHRGGIAFDKETNKIYMVDRENNTVQAAKYKSCVDIEKAETISFGKKMKKIDTLAVGAGRLWLGLSARDDYYNNAVFTYKLP